MKTICKTLALALSAASPTFAATLVTFDFSSASPTTELTQLTGSAGDLSFATAWTLDTVNENAFSDTTRIGTNGAVQAISFTYTVTGLGVDEVLDFDSMTIDFTGAYYNTGSRFSLTDNGNRADTIPTNWNPAPTVTFSNPAALSTGLVNGDTANFRFSYRDSVVQNPVEPYSVDNFTVFGTIRTVPEPNSVMLLGLGVAGYLIRRRRHS